MLRSTDSLLNGVFDNIKHTLQAESDNRLPFLYILIIRSNREKIKTPSHRKPDHIDQMLSYNSNNPVTWRISCTKTRFETVKTRCNTIVTRGNKKNSMDVIWQNGNSRNFIRICLLNWLSNTELTIKNQRTGSLILHECIWLL